MSVFSQSYKINNRVKIYARDMGDSVILKSSNDLTIPVTVRLFLTLSNLSADSNPTSFIIPAKSSEKTIAVLKRIDAAKSYKCTFSWRIAPGDVSKTPDLSYTYGFPYMKGRSYMVTQGPHGPFSHKNIFAYDFDMPVGTPVCAARDGIVAFVKNDSDKGGPDKKYINEANFVSVYHTDGTMANYYHLSKAHQVVKEGQFIKKGQIIGYSGNTGYSDGAHLHFEVTQPTITTDTKQWLAFKWEFPAGEETLSMNINEAEVNK